MRKTTPLILALLLSGLLLSACGSSKNNKKGCGGETCPIGGIALVQPNRK
ncbi:MAG: hypothetical protein HUJ60_06725 [Bacilli bacterium]|nr:hypothetical protein [Bacilli bacterium]